MPCTENGGFVRELGSFQQLPVAGWYSNSPCLGPWPPLYPLGRYGVDMCLAGCLAFLLFVLMFFFYVVALVATLHMDELFPSVMTWSCARQERLGKSDARSQTDLNTHVTTHLRRLRPYAISRQEQTAAEATHGTQPAPGISTQRFMKRETTAHPTTLSWPKARGVRSEAQG